nr:MAG TPA: hypothetical protein [Caudoviricetes sp.]
MVYKIHLLIYHLKYQAIMQMYLVVLYHLQLSNRKNFSFVHSTYVQVHYIPYKSLMNLHNIMYHL